LCTESLKCSRFKRLRPRKNLYENWNVPRVEWLPWSSRESGSRKPDGEQIALSEALQIALPERAVLHMPGNSQRVECLLQPALRGFQSLGEHPMKKQLLVLLASTLIEVLYDRYEKKRAEKKQLAADENPKAA
jgi:hypothetical protein